MDLNLPSWCIYIFYLSHAIVLVSIFLLFSFNFFGLSNFFKFSISFICQVANVHSACLGEVSMQIINPFIFVWQWVIWEEENRRVQCGYKDPCNFLGAAYLQGKHKWFIIVNLLHKQHNSSMNKNKNFNIASPLSFLTP